MTTPPSPHESEREALAAIIAPGARDWTGRRSEAVRLADAILASGPWPRSAQPDGAVREAEADVIRHARALVMEPGGLRMTPGGTYIVERADKSDPHYRLCDAFKRLDALPSAPSSQPVER